MCKRLFLSTTFVALVTGCSSHRSAADRATEAIRKTGEYKSFVRNVANPVALMVERQTHDAVEIGMFENAPDAFHRGGMFRVSIDGRVEISDPADPDWRPAHLVLH